MQPKFFAGSVWPIKKGHEGGLDGGLKPPPGRAFEQGRKIKGFLLLFFQHSEC